MTRKRQTTHDVNTLVNSIVRRIVFDMSLVEGTSRMLTSLFEVSGAKSVSDADDAEFALLIDAGKNMFILYEPEAVIDAIKRHVTDDGSYMRSLDPAECQDAIVAFIELKNKERNRAWNANSIKVSAANGGYGPMMYDIAMSHSGRIMSDRLDVSKSAKKVWKYYRDNRSDVEAFELDDENNPKTKTPTDDAMLHFGGKENPLNYAYELTQGIDYSKLIARHKKEFPKIEDFADEHGIVFTRDSLILAAYKFFDMKYGS